MIKIETKGKTLHIPSQWKDIRMGSYEQWFGRRPQSESDVVKLVADISGTDYDLLMESPPELFDAIAATINFVFDPETDIAPSPTIEIEGVKYSISFSEKLTLGEWIDVESVLESESDTKISETLAILCRPLGESYNADLTESRKEMFRNLTCDKTLPLLAFFLLKKKKSEAILHHYSMVLGQAARFVKDTKTFAQNGGGIKRLPIWQRIKYTYLMKSLEKQLSKLSDFYFTKSTNRVPKKRNSSLKSS